MAKRTFIQRRAVRIGLAVGLAGILLLGLLAGGGLLYLRSRDRATPVSTGGAVRRYRDDHGGASPRGSTGLLFPAEGVYVYATHGGEEVDALGGARHDYPPETTITIHRVGCGESIRWDALQERWDQRSTCAVGGAEELRSFSTQHEFFGRPDHRDVSFEPGSLTRPVPPTPGTTWNLRATGSGMTITGHGELIGLERLSVDGEEVDTMHIRVATESRGNARGNSERDSWLRVIDGLLIHETARTQSVTDSPIGPVHYSEHDELTLKSLTPNT